MILTVRVNASKIRQLVYLPFCDHAGSKLNVQKTECILLGNLKNKYDKIDGIKVTNGAVKCLGIYLGHNQDECYTKNWLEKYDQVQNIFEVWKKRHLTIFGKKCVINSLVMSKFMYVASILPLPDDNFIQNVKRSIFNFIWNKTDRIKRNTIIGKICDGGVGIVDFELKLKAIKASWICRISSETSVLYDVVNSYSNRYGVNIEYLLKLSETNVKTFESLSSTRR